MFHYVDTYVYKVDSMDKTPKIDYNKTNNAQQEGSHLLFRTSDRCLLKALVSNHKWRYTNWISKIVTGLKK